MQESKGKRYARLADGAELLDLSDREREVARQLLSGLTAEEAAKDLGVGIATVKSLRSRIYNKLGIHTTMSLANRALTSLCRHCRAAKRPWLDTEVDLSGPRPHRPSDTV